MNMAQLRLKYDGKVREDISYEIESHSNKRHKFAKRANIEGVVVEEGCSSLSKGVEEGTAFDSASVALTRLPESFRPRERLVRFGASSLLDEELLAIMLRTGAQGKNVLCLAQQLLENFGSLSQLMNAGLEELKSYGGIGQVKAIELAAMLELSRRVIMGGTSRREVFNAPENVVKRVNLIKALSQTESFFVFPLDKRCRLCTLNPIEISSGTLDSSLVHPREVFREAIRFSAASIIIAHNHPSGDCTPSRADIEITKKIIEAGQQLSIPVLDHVVVGDEHILPPGFCSMNRERIMNF